MLLRDMASERQLGRYVPTRRPESGLDFLISRLPLRFTLADAVASFHPEPGHGPEQAGRWCEGVAARFPLVLFSVPRAGLFWSPIDRLRDGYSYPLKGRGAIVSRPSVPQQRPQAFGFFPGHLVRGFALRLVAAL